jgi:hypothetical protein
LRYKFNEIAPLFQDAGVRGYICVQRPTNSEYQTKTSLNFNECGHCRTTNSLSDFCAHFVPELYGTCIDFRGWRFCFVLSKSAVHIRSPAFVIEVYMILLSLSWKMPE